MLIFAMEAGSGEALLALIAMGCVIAAYCAGRKQAARLSRVTRVVNTSPKLGAANEYCHVRVEDLGETKDLLFHSWQIRDAAYRAAQNPEDMPEFTD